MLPQRRAASFPLKSLVRGYEERAASFGVESITHPLPARPDQFIEIYCAERYRVSQDGRPAEWSPEVSLVGPHGRGRTQLLLAGEIRAFSIRLQPGALHRLCGIDMAELANRGVALADVLGRATAPLRDGVMAADGFDARVLAAERWLAGMAENAGGPSDRIDLSARLLLRSAGQVRVARLADWAGVS